MILRRAFKVSRDDTLIQQIIKEEQRFWHYVQTDTPPPADASESAAKALKLLYPCHQPNKVVDFTDDAFMNQLFQQYVATQKRNQQQQKQLDTLKNQLQAGIEDAEKAIFTQGTVTWKNTKDSETLDTKALLAAQPDLLAQFTQVRKGSRRFMVYPNNKTNSTS